MRDFFISFTNADRAWAEWIAETLQTAGYSVVYQGWDFLPGNNFVLEMEKGLTEAKRVLLVLSPQFFHSSFTQSEWSAAFAKDPAGTARTIIPVVIEPCDLGSLLRPIIHIDLVGTEEEEGRQRLLAGVAQNRQHRASVAFPGAAKIS
jgi:TIR domain